MFSLVWFSSDSSAVLFSLSTGVSSFSTYSWTCSWTGSRSQQGLTSPSSGPSVLLWGHLSLPLLSRPFCLRFRVGHPTRLFFSGTTPAARSASWALLGRPASPLWPFHFVCVLCSEFPLVHLCASSGTLRPLPWSCIFPVDFQEGVERNACVHPI